MLLTTYSTHGFAYWALKAFAIVLALYGLALAAGGLWLVTLGGSWYYLPAGIGMLVSGILLLFMRIQGVWLYWLVFVATLVWALWEVGLEPWPLVPPSGRARGHRAAYIAVHPHGSPPLELR